MYLLIRPDEDGNPIRVLDDDGLAELLEDPEGSHGVTEFLDEWPTAREDPNYWADGTAILLRAEVLKVRPAEIVTRWTAS